MSLPTRDEAARQLKLGQALEGEGNPAALERAIAHYNEAIALLQELPLDHDPGLRRELGVAWMNRGNALQKRPEAASLASAVRAYEAAIALLRELPIAENAADRNTLGAACLNRGHALLLQGGPVHAAAAVAALRDAISWLADLPLAENPAYRINLAGAWVNLANALLGGADADRFPSARAAALAGLQLVAESEDFSPAAAEMGLKARRALCEVIGQQVVLDLEHSAALAAEASDLVDDGLALTRRWEHRGIIQLRPVAARLFRFGAQLYRVNQPHFLPEFLLENLDPSHTPNALPQIKEFHQIAAEAFGDAVRDSQRTRHLKLDDPESMRQLQAWRDLLAVAPRLAELRQKYFPARPTAAVKPATPPARG